MSKNDWSDIVDWTHSWDMADMIGYDDDGLLWTIRPQRRVESVADRGGKNYPLKRDGGIWGPILGVERIPGPAMIPSSLRFNGRPAMLTDCIGGDGAFGQVYTMLSPHDNPKDRNLWFNPPHGYPVPYWAAFLCLPTDGFEYRFGAWDAFNGEIGTTATIGHAVNRKTSRRCWGMTTSLWLGDPWPTTDIPGSELQTVLVIAKVDGESSFMQISWRNVKGEFVSVRTELTLARRTAKEIFFGYVHTSYLSVVGMKVGVPSEEEIEAVCEWSSRWIPRTGYIPAEPA